MKFTILTVFYGFVVLLGVQLNSTLASRLMTVEKARENDNRLYVSILDAELDMPTSLPLNGDFMQPDEFPPNSKESFSFIV